MNRELPETSRREDELNEIILTYLDTRQAGECVDREAFLAQHGELRPELETFLAAYEETERLTAPLREASKAVQDEEARRPDGTGAHGASAHGAGAASDIGRLGDFRLLREIGRGGMGVVYEAEQISLRRRVALKVLPFAAAIDPRQLQRFQNEAMAAASLRHENIVPVHAVGVERGVHYYAMQFIEGQSLSEIIAELRAQNPDPKKKTDSGAGAGSSAGAPKPVFPPAQASQQLSPGHPTTPSNLQSTVCNLKSLTSSVRGREFFRFVARLGRQAALALEHAHHMGIVHRDIKPANLLLDAMGHVWVTDFGLAQFQSHAGVTMTGELLGTLRYVSPEQAMAKRGVVDHRADIYSLGATLYELLTQRPIFEGADRHALLTQLGFSEPIAPRKHNASIPVELETIILKSVAKSPADRYGTAQELADDLQRYLDDKPIQAKRPSLIERGRKWSRRHPALVAASALVLVLALAGLVVGGWLVQAALLQGEKARAAEARRAVDMLVAVAEDELADNRQLEDTRRRLLETALAYYQEYVDKHGSDAAQAELEAERNRVQSILDELATLRTARMIGLANEPDVQDDLGLGETEGKQLDRLKRRSFRQQDTLRRERSLTLEVRRKREYELAKGQETALANILKDKLPRLKQIELQTQGPGAFKPHTYATGILKITVEQRQRIREINEDAFSAIHRGKGGLNTKEEFDELFQRVQKEEVARIIEVLSPEQHSRWREMTGRPFEGRIGRRW